MTNGYLLRKQLPIVVQGLIVIGERVLIPLHIGPVGLGQEYDCAAYADRFVLVVVVDDDLVSRVHPACVIDTL